MMTASTDISSYRHNGFLLLKDFLPAGEVERVREDAKAAFRTQLLRRGLLAGDAETEEEFNQALFRYFKIAPEEFAHVGKQAQHLISLHRLALDSRIIDKIVDLGLEQPNISTRPVLYFNSRHLAREEVYWRVFAHQDWRSMQGSLDAIVVWVPLAKVDRSLGALEVVPGSHKAGLLTSELVSSFGKVDEYSDADFTAVEVEPGDALFFSSFLVHRSGENSTDEIRWSCHFRYNNLAEPTFIERGFPHAYIYRPVDDLITPGGFPEAEQVGRVYRSE
jgi:phytanoyl-CoA hydroxylase